MQKMLSIKMQNCGKVNSYYQKKITNRVGISYGEFPQKGHIRCLIILALYEKRSNINMIHKLYVCRDCLSNIRTAKPHHSLQTWQIYLICSTISTHCYRHKALLQIFGGKRQTLKITKTQ